MSGPGEPRTDEQKRPGGFHFRPPPVSERLAEALRNDDLDAFASETPYSRALLELLRALGWHQFTRELLEALPHFSDDFDLLDLRNVLVSLGYESRALQRRVGKLDEQLLPCLFVGERGQLLVLQEREADCLRYLDCHTGEQHCDRDVERLRGTAYVLTDTHPTHGALPAGQDDWTSRLLGRFQKLLLHMLAMTFFINLVALAVPIFVMLVYDKVIGGKSLDSLPYMLAGVGIALLADFCFRYLRARLLGTVAGRLDYLIGVETFKQLLYLPPMFTERSTVAAQLSRLRQFDSLRDFFTGPGASVVLELPFSLLFILVIALIAGPVALVPLLAIVVYLVMGLVVLPTLDNSSSESGRASSEKQNMLLQGLEGLMEIKAIGGERVWLERYREHSGESATAAYRTARANAIATAAGQMVMSFAAIVVIWWGAAQVMAGDISVGALIATMALLWRVLTPLQSAYLSATRFQQIVKAVQQINQLMKIKLERHSVHSGLLMRELRGGVRLDRVSFRYAADKDPSVLGVSFEAKPGELVAITGETGAGKSSVLKLIAGMYKPQAGALYLDAMDIRQFNPADLRRTIAYVPQDPRMFHGSITQNLRLNNGLATADELVEAAREAGVLDDIMNLPEGFETRIGDNNTDRFPPGFLQGLALARALVRPTRIVLLDEPGASLDGEADAKLINRLKLLRGKRTVIMVTHRPSHIRLADKVVLMQSGSVAMVNTPDKVLPLLLGIAK